MKLQPRKRTRCRQVRTYFVLLDVGGVGDRAFDLCHLSNLFIECHAFQKIGHPQFHRLVSVLVEDIACTDLLQQRQAGEQQHQHQHKGASHGARRPHFPKNNLFCTNKETKKETSQFVLFNPWSSNAKHTRDHFDTLQFWFAALSSSRAFIHHRPCPNFFNHKLFSLLTTLPLLQSISTFQARSTDRNANPHKHATSRRLKMEQSVQCQNSRITAATSKCKPSQ